MATTLDSTVLQGAWLAWSSSTLTLSHLLKWKGALAGVAQLVGALSCKPKGHGSDSVLGHVPRLRVWAQGWGTYKGQSVTMFLFPNAFSCISEWILWKIEEIIHHRLGVPSPPPDSGHFILFHDSLCFIFSLSLCPYLFLSCLVHSHLYSETSLLSHIHLRPVLFMMKLVSGVTGTDFATLLPPALQASADCCCLLALPHPSCQWPLCRESPCSSQSFLLELPIAVVTVACPILPLVCVTRSADSSRALPTLSFLESKSDCLPTPMVTG